MPMFAETQLNVRNKKVQALFRMLFMLMTGLLILPVLTLTLVELGYILRITRASMVEVMKSPYIRTAHLKGPKARHQFRDVLR